MSHDDFEFEPQRGLPAALPEGERLLWQGSPNWKALAIRAYHARKAGIYFLVLIAWRIGTGVIQLQPASSIALGCLSLFALGTGAVVILSTLAYLSSRAAVYSITNRRVLLRHGVAVSITLNIPFKAIESADVRTFPKHRGDIMLRIFADQRVGYLITWPYLRPGKITRPEPSLRALDRADQAAKILGGAFDAYNARSAPNTSDFEPSGLDLGRPASRPRTARAATAA